MLSLLKITDCKHISKVLKYTVNLQKIFIHSKNAKKNKIKKILIILIITELIYKEVPSSNKIQSNLHIVVL